MHPHDRNGICLPQKYVASYSYFLLCGMQGRNKLGEKKLLLVNKAYTQVLHGEHTLNEVIWSHVMANYVNSRLRLRNEPLSATPRPPQKKIT